MIRRAKGTESGQRETRDSRDHDETIKTVRAEQKKSLRIIRPVADTSALEVIRIRAIRLDDTIRQAIT